MSYQHTFANIVFGKLYYAFTIIYGYHSMTQKPICRFNFSVKLFNQLYSTICIAHITCELFDYVLCIQMG